MEKGEQSRPEFLTPENELWLKDQYFLESNHEALMQANVGKWIAIRDEQVVGSDTDYKKLIDKLHESKEYLPPRIIHYLNPKKKNGLR